MKKLRQLVVIVVALTLIVSGCGPNAPTSPPPAPAQPTAASIVQEKNPETVLRAITDALNKKDAEAAAAYLADDVTQTLIPAPSGTGIYRGKDALRARFKEVVAANPTHKLSSCQTSGDKVTCDAAYTDDSIKPLGFDLEFKVEAVVQGGLLKTVTWKMTDQSLAKMQAAMGPPSTPTPARSAAPLEPEVLASKSEDVIGVWLINLIQGAGKGHFEFKPDGTYSITGVSGAAAGAPIDSGKYQFEGGQLKLDTDCVTVKGDVIPCVATYQVYVTKQGGKPVGLRFVAIDDQGDRKQTLDSRKLTLVEQ